MYSTTGSVGQNLNWRSQRRGRHKNCRSDKRHGRSLKSPLKRVHGKELDLKTCRRSAHRTSAAGPREPQVRGGVATGRGHPQQRHHAQSSGPRSVVDLNAALVKARQRVTPADASGRQLAWDMYKLPFSRGTNVHDHTRLHGAAADHDARPPHLGLTRYPDAGACFQRNIESVAGTDVSSTHHRSSCQCAGRSPVGALFPSFCSHQSRSARRRKEKTLREGESGCRETCLDVSVRPSVYRLHATLCQVHVCLNTKHITSQASHHAQVSLALTKPKHETRILFIH